MLPLRKRGVRLNIAIRYASVILCRPIARNRPFRMEIAWCKMLVKTTVLSYLGRALLVKTKVPRGLGSDLACKKNGSAHFLQRGLPK